MIQRRKSSWIPLTSVLLVLLTGLPVAADEPWPGPDDESDWNNLQQLRAGDKVEIVDTNLKKLKGTFLSFSEEAISLRVGKEEVGVQRPNVFRVSSREHSKRLRNALIGVAIGGGIGVAVGAWLQSRERMGTGPVMLLGIGIGAGLGASIPSYETVYRGKRQP